MPPSDLIMPASTDVSAMPAVEVLDFVEFLGMQLGGNNAQLLEGTGQELDDKLPRVRGHALPQRGVEIPEGAGRVQAQPRTWWILSPANCFGREVDEILQRHSLVPSS